MVAVPMIDTAVPFIFFFLFPYALAFLRKPSIAPQPAIEPFFPLRT